VLEPQGMTGFQPSFGGDRRRLQELAISRRLFDASLCRVGILDHRMHVDFNLRVRFSRSFDGDLLT
jgi:hypothetical protein